jgi:hypothetical protein
MDVSSGAFTSANIVNSLVLKNDGNVGIGTTSPTEKLDVRSGAIANGNGTIKTVLSYTTEGLVGTLSNHALLFYSNNTEKARITSAGLVGIGTTSPAAILDVVNTGRIQGILRTQSTPRTTFYDNTFAVGTDGGGATGFIYTSGTGGTFPLDFYGELILQSSPRTGYNNGISLVTGTTSPSVKLRISEVGNVGIGTTSPNELLEVSGTSPIIRVLATSGNSTLRLTDNGVRNWDLKVVDVSDYFEVGGTSATSLVVTGAGNVGIGTTSPTDKLDVNGAVYIRGGNSLKLDNTSNNYVAQISNGGSSGASTLVFQTGGSARMRIINNGNVGIGTATPSTELEVVGTITCTTLVETSSMSSKTNIKKLTSQTEKIAKLSPVSFNYKINNKCSLGLIAEEVAKVYPELVEYENDRALGVNYSKLTSVLISAVNELAAEVAELKKQLIK